MLHEQVAHRLPGQLVREGPLGPVLAQVDDLLQDSGSICVQRDDAFLVSLAGGQPQPGGAVGVAVQAVDGQPADLVPAGPGPAGDQQRGTLEGTGDLLDHRHQPIQFVVRDEPRDLDRRLRRVAGADQAVAGDAIPLPSGGVPEELAQPGGPLDPGDDAERLTGLLRRRLGDVLEPAQAVVAGHVGERVDLGMVFAEPVPEATDRKLKLVHGRRTVRQPPGGEPLLRDGLHLRGKYQRRLPGGHQLAGLRRDLATVVEHNLQLVEMGDPVLGSALQVALPGRVEPLQVRVVSEEPDRLQSLGDVVLGDRGDVEDTGVQGDATDRPVHRLTGRVRVEAQADGIVDELLGAQVDAERGGRLDDRELPGGEQPRVVERRVAAQPEVDQVGAGPERHRVGRAVVRLAVQPADPLDQRGTEPAGQLGPALDELPAEPQLHQLVLAVAVLPLDIGTPLLLRAVPPAAALVRNGARVCQHGRCGDGPGPHFASPVAELCPPRARLYSATTVGSETRV